MHLDDSYSLWNKPRISYAPISERQKLEAEKAAIEAKLARLDRFGDDDYDDHAVLQFTKKYGTTSRAQTYTFVAIKAGGRWWVSDVNSPSDGRSWAQLVDFILDNNKVDPDVHYMTQMEAA